MLEVGEGRVALCPGTDDFVQLPACVTTSPGSTLNDLVAGVFPDLGLRLADNPGAGQFFGERAMLTTRNDDVDAINETCVEAFCPDVQVTVLLSADQVDDVDNSALYPAKLLNTLTVSGLPPHHLALKVGCPIMMLHNMRAHPEMVNGARLIVRAISRIALDAVGDFQGTQVFIPRISMGPSDDVLPFKFTHLQFPVRPAFAISINRSQGQALERILCTCHSRCFPTATCTSPCPGWAPLTVYLSWSVPWTRTPEGT